MTYADKIELDIIKHTRYQTDRERVLLEALEEAEIETSLEIKDLTEEIERLDAENNNQLETIEKQDREIDELKDKIEDLQEAIKDLEAEARQ